MFVCLFVRWGSGVIPMVTAREDGYSRLEPSKDQREYLSLVLKDVYCSSVSVDCSGLLAVVLMRLDPRRKDLGFLHPMW